MSGAENGSSTLRLGREISPTMGTSGMGIFGAGIASKVMLTRGLFAGVQQEETRLEDRLLNSKNSPALLYDVERKTGFLVPELSLVLQILHIWAARQPDSDEILRKVPFVSTSATNTSEEAFRAVILNKNVMLREAYAEEKPLFLMTKLKDIFLAMEKRKEQRRLIKESSISLPGLPYLRGWELLDVAACRPSWDKRIKLEQPGSAHSWYKIARDNDDMIVFFSKGMADAIILNRTRVCPAWNPLPQDHYLLASVHCVRRLSERNGGTGKGIKLTRRLFLCNDKDMNPFGVCPKTMDACCSHIHSLESRGPDKAVLLEEDGAVLLGRPSIRKEEARGYNSMVMPRERTSKGFQLYSRMIDRKS